MRRNVVWNCNGVMVKGNNHTIEHNTIFATDPLNFESDGQPRDLALYSWSDFGTCQCTDTFCLALNETCCVPDDPNTYENLFSVVTNNGLDGLVGSVGGTDAVPSTAAVDAMFAVAKSENNSAGGLYCAAGQKLPPACLGTHRPSGPPGGSQGLQPLLRTPERRPSSLEARGRLRSPPPLAPKLGPLRLSLALATYQVRAAA